MLNDIKNTLKKINTVHSANIDDLNLGKYKCIANVKEIEYKLKMNCFGVDILEPYLYLENLQVFQSDKYINVETSNVIIKTKIGKRIADSQLLANGDRISFNAYLREKTNLFRQEDEERIIDEEYTSRYFNSFSNIVRLNRIEENTNDCSRKDGLK